LSGMSPAAAALASPTRALAPPELPLEPPVAGVEPEGAELGVAELDPPQAAVSATVAIAPAIAIRRYSRLLMIASSSLQPEHRLNAH
jgi:hypothetical protein